jgi:hypothetical protein
MGKLLRVHTLVLGVAVAILIAVFASATAEKVWAQSSHSISLPWKRQEQDQWCWAAATQAVASYYGKNPSQCEIVGKLYITCPNWPAHIGDVHALVFPNYDLTGDYLTRSMLWDEVVNTIWNGRPAIIRWEWRSDGAGHMVVIYGWQDITPSDRRVLYMNPVDGAGYIRDYNNLVSNSSWTWTHSVTHIRR